MTLTPMLFQTDIDKINTEIAQLQELIAAKQQRQSQLVHLQNIADEAVKSVQNVICLLSSPDARVTLKSAIVGLFDGIDDSSDTTPTPSEKALVSVLEPEPEPEAAPAPSSEDSSPESSPESAASPAAASVPEPELIQVTELVSYMREADGEIQCTYVGFNNKSKAKSWGEWLSSSIVAKSESCAAGIAYKFEVKRAVQLPFLYELLVWGLNLNQVNQLARIDFSKTPFVKSGKALKRPLETSQLLESTHRETDLSTEQLTESDTPTVSEIDVNAGLYQSDTLEAYPELAVTENSSNQSISEDTEEATIKPVLNGKVTSHINRPTHEITLPTATPSFVAPKLSDLEPGDIVGSLSVPGWTYKVLKVNPNGQLSCERLISSGQCFNVALDINSVYLIEKAPRKAPSPESSPLLDTSVDQHISGDGETRRRGVFDAAHSMRPGVLETAASSDKAANDEATVTSTSPEPELAATQLDEPMTPLMLASLIRAAWSWEEIEAATTNNEQQKKAAWSLLTQKEKNQVLALKLQAQQEERWNQQTG